MEIAAVALSVVAFLLLVVAAALRPLLPRFGFGGRARDRFGRRRGGRTRLRADRAP